LVVINRNLTGCIIDDLGDCVSFFCIIYIWGVSSAFSSSLAP
jgi:hypothetical protein